jgi:hypothetical protein
VSHIVCVCVCLFGWSSSVRVFLFGRWCRLVGREERAYRRLKETCDLCVFASFGWFGVGLACKEVAICVHLVQEGRNVGGLLVV